MTGSSFGSLPPPPSLNLEYGFFFAGSGFLGAEGDDPNEGFGLGSGLI